MSLLSRILATRAPAAVMLVRLMVGGVFLTEGVLKFLWPAELGAGRFATIGIPHPEIMGPFVGVVETVGGILVILGLLTRLASLALWIDISVAILSTKAPILLGHAYWIFSLPQAKHYGLWGMLHEARTDFSMWLGSLFLLIVGAGILSIDAMLTGRETRTGGGVSRV